MHDFSCCSKGIDLNEELPTANEKKNPKKAANNSSNRKRTVKPPKKKVCNCVCLYFSLHYTPFTNGIALLFQPEKRQKRTVTPSPTLPKEKSVEEKARELYDVTTEEGLALFNKEVKCKCNHKKHFDHHSFLEYDHTYYKPNYIQQKEYWPMECFSCGDVFSVEDPKDPNAKVYKVDAKHPVIGCKDAMNGDEECIKAFCRPCYVKLLDMPR